LATLFKRFIKEGGVRAPLDMPAKIKYLPLGLKMTDIDRLIQQQIFQAYSGQTNK
jgi:hypothetical protein